MKRNVHVICLQAIAFARTTTTSTTKQSDVRAEQVASCRSKEVLVCEGRYLMANNLFRFGSRRLLPSLRCLVHPHLRMKSESAKEAFQKIFPRMGASRLKPRYDANSYGQTVGPEYPFDIEKTPEGKIKREKSKGTMGSVSVEEIVEILRANGGENIKVAKLHQDLHYADHFIVVSGKDTEHLKKMTQNLATKLISAYQGDSVHVEGLGSFDWMVVDAGQIVVHLFLQHIRDDYNIDEAWAEHEGSSI